MPNKESEKRRKLQSEMRKRGVTDPRNLPRSVLKRIGIDTFQEAYSIFYGRPSPSNVPAPGSLPRGSGISDNALRLADAMENYITNRPTGGDRGRALDTLDSPRPSTLPTPPRAITPTSSSRRFSGGYSDAIPVSVPPQPQSKPKNSFLKDLLNLPISIARGYVDAAKGGVRNAADIASYNEQWGMPNIPSFAAPPPPPPQFNFELGDFSDKAAEMAGRAYSPVLEAIERAKRNVQAQNERSREIVQGLYKGLLDNIAENTGTISDRYSDAQQRVQQGGQDLSDRIGGTYESSQNLVADLINKIGGGVDAAAAVLPDNASDQAYYQQQALTGAQDHSNYLDSLSQAAQDYQAAQQQAQATQGAYTQQDLLRQRDAALSDWDWRDAQIRSQQAQQEIGLANQLSGQDLDLQRLNYGALQDNYSNLLRGSQMSNQQAMDAYGLQMDRYGMMQQAEAAQRQAEIDRRNDNFNRQMQLIDRILGAERIKVSREKMADGPDISGIPGAEFDRTISYYFPSPEESQLAKSLLLSVTQDEHAARIGIEGSPWAFGNYVREKTKEYNLANPGRKLDEEKMAQIGQAFFTSELSKSRKK